MTDGSIGLPPKDTRAPGTGLSGAWRGPGPGRPDVVLPPAAMPAMQARRPLKQWRWVGLFGPELSICIGTALVWPARQSWWAIWDRSGRRLREQGRLGRGGIRLEPGRALLDDDGVRVDLAFVEGGASTVEVVTPDGRGHTWTRKEIVDAQGSVWLEGRRHPVSGPLVIDDSAGYHARHTAWRWSCGVGRGEDGHALAWNLVTGVHDSPQNSERTVWVDGIPQEVGPVDFDPSLELITGRRRRAPARRDGGHPPPRRGSPRLRESLPPAVRHVLGDASGRGAARRGPRGDGAPRCPLVSLPAAM